MNPAFGYCTNVHAGTTLATIMANLQQYAGDVRQRFCPGGELPVGLWISDVASRELESESAVSGFRRWLGDAGFCPYTLNGFPFRDFHQPVVKHDVYLPGWDDPARLEFTHRLARILAGLLSGNRTSATISTLPIGWPVGTKQRGGKTLATRFADADRERLISGARHLKQLAVQLRQIALETGVAIQVCLEPEPGCLLDCADDLVLFFESLLLDDLAQRDLVQRHLGVCHDVCHSAVMFEPQALALEAYRKAGIGVGKIQVSAAVEARFDSPTGALAGRPWHEIQQALSTFAESRYLHQTTIRTETTEGAGELQYFEDLNLALSSAKEPQISTWRVHFHVPIFLRQLGALDTTQDAIRECLRWLPGLNQAIPPQWEVETYAWNVLPGNQDESSLSAGIAQELAWLQQVSAELSP